MKIYGSNTGAAHIREDKINLVGATQGITVRLRYEEIPPQLTLGTDPVQIRSA